MPPASRLHIQPAAIPAWQAASIALKSAPLARKRRLSSASSAASRGLPAAALAISATSFSNPAWPICRSPLDPASGRRAEPRLEGRDPVLGPGDADLLGDRAGARIVLQHLADALGVERGERLVEALAAMAEGLRIGAVAERQHAVAHAAQVGAALLEILVEPHRVVGHVALAVGRGADEIGAAGLDGAGVEAVHRPDLDLVALRLEGVADLLGDQLRGPRHGADEN